MEESAIVKVKQAHCLIVAPLTRQSAFGSESHFTTIYAHLCDRPFRFRDGKFLSLHLSMLTAMTDFNARESSEVNKSILVGRKLNNIGIIKLQNISHNLMDMLLKAESITQNMENALLNADTQKLEIYTQNLREISQKIRINLDNDLLLEKEKTL